jgi:hypothetical protein
MLLILNSLAGYACHRHKISPARAMPSTHSTPELPPYGLYTRQGDQIVEAPAADLAVARSYAGFPDKGPVVDGRRLTLLTAAQRYRVGEEIRIIHVAETVGAELQTYLMGPKPIYEEYCDGRLVSPALPDGEDPFIPSTLNGRVQSGPTIDFNYEISTYAIKTLGTHTFEWRLGNGKSNVLTITIAD